jgi:hypothetical protein
MILCILLFIPHVALSFPCGMTYELAKTCKDLIDTKSFTPELATCQAKFNEICNVDDCKQSYFCKSCDSLFNGDQAALMMGMPATCTSAFNQIIANDLTCSKSNIQLKENSVIDENHNCKDTIQRGERCMRKCNQDAVLSTSTKNANKEIICDIGSDSNKISVDFGTIGLDMKCVKAKSCSIPTTDQLPEGAAVTTDCIDGGDPRTYCPTKCKPGYIEIKPPTSISGRCFGDFDTNGESLGTWSYSNFDIQCQSCSDIPTYGHYKHTNDCDLTHVVLVTNMKLIVEGIPIIQPDGSKRLPILTQGPLIDSHVSTLWDLNLCIQSTSCDKDDICSFLKNENIIDANTVNTADVQYKLINGYEEYVHSSKDGPKDVPRKIVWHYYQHTRRKYGGKKPKCWRIVSQKPRNVKP